MLSYSTYLGGSSSDSGEGIAVDTSGNAYVTGETSSTDFPTASPLQAAAGGGIADAFVAKISDDQSPVIADIFLHANGSILFLDSIAPTATTAQFKDSASIKFNGGNLWKEVGIWTTTVGSAETLTALSDLHAWLGLKNSDDQGTRFDLRAEVLRNGILVATGETYCITGVTRNPSLAQEATVSFGPFPAENFVATDVLSLKVSTRIGTNGVGAFCGGHSNAVGLRLYFDAVSRPARFGAIF